MTGHELIVGIVLVVLALIYFYLKSKPKAPIDNTRRAFSNMEKFRVAEKCVLDYGRLQCYECGTTKKDLDIDHIRPLSRKGHNGLSNLCLKCYTCNRRKGNKKVG